MNKLYEVRFWSKVDKNGEVMPGMKSRCWVWTHYTNPKGYGTCYMGAGAMKAHRVAYSLHYKVPVDGLIVRHRCDNPSCVRPSHLSVGSHQDNVDDRTRRGRQRCAHGETHPLSKLTAADVRRIRASTGGCREVAKQYGVAFSLIHRIRTRQSWNHVK